MSLPICVSIQLFSSLGLGLSAVSSPLWSCHFDARERTTHFSNTFLLRNRNVLSIQPTAHSTYCEESLFRTDDAICQLRRFSLLKLYESTPITPALSFKKSGSGWTKKRETKKRTNKARSSNRNGQKESDKGNYISLFQLPKSFVAIVLQICRLTEWYYYLLHYKYWECLVFK